MKKKSIAVVMALVLEAVALSGCGGNSSASQASQESAPAVESSSEQENQDEVEQEAKDQETEEVIEEKAENTEVNTTFGVGDTWIVDGQWALTITDVEETEERNEYSDKEPAAVYIVSYVYENLGYIDSNGLMDGLYFSFDDMIVDNGGKMGYTYPGDIINNPQEIPVGAYCEAQSCIGVDNPGVFTIQYSKYDGNEKNQSATLVFDPDAEPTEAPRVGTYNSMAEYKEGDTWEVEGQWKLTITDIQETDDRNDYFEKSPDAVYVISYTYENLGYVDESGLMDGLYFSLDEMIVDSDGKMGYTYPGDIEYYPQEVPVGAICDAQTCIGVDHAGNFDVTVMKYDGNEVKQTAVFGSSFE